MANLNEDVLRHIFKFLDTPLEWIQVSEVCQLWRRAALDQWKQITEINYLPSDLKSKLKPDERNHAPFISEKEAKKMVQYAAPFVNVLGVSPFYYLSSGFSNCLVKFGRFVYNVRHFDTYRTLWLLADITTNITELHFDYLPERRYLKLLFKNNNIKRMKCKKQTNFYKDFSTYGIEELGLFFKNDENLYSFEGRFPNLKKLDLEINCNYSTDFYKILIFTLSHVLDLTELKLKITSTHPRRFVSYYDFLDIAELSQLEKLSLVFENFDLDYGSDFIQKVTEGCPKLRSVELNGLKICEVGLYALMNLPQLENLEITSGVSSFRLQSEILPEMPKMSRLRLGYSLANTDIRSVCGVLQKMPNLTNLELEPQNVDIFDVFELNDDSKTLRIVCQILNLAVSQGKNIVLSKLSDDEQKVKFEIAKKKEQRIESEIRMLNFTVPFRNEKDFYRGIKSFVQNNLRSYYMEAKVDGRSTGKRFFKSLSLTVLSAYLGYILVRYLS